MSNMALPSANYTSCTAFQRPQKSSDVCPYVALGVVVRVLKLEDTSSISICDEGIRCIVNLQTGLIIFFGVGDKEHIMYVVPWHRDVASDRHE